MFVAFVLQVYILPYFALDTTLPSGAWKSLCKNKCFASDICPPLLASDNRCRLSEKRVKSYQNGTTKEERSCRENETIFQTIHNVFICVQGTAHGNSDYVDKGTDYSSHTNLSSTSAVYTNNNKDRCTAYDNTNIIVRLHGTNIILPFVVHSGMALRVFGAGSKLPSAYLMCQRYVNKFSFVLDIEVEFVRRAISWTMGLEKLDKVYKDDDFPISDRLDFNLTVELHAQNTTITANGIMVGTSQPVSGVHRCTLRYFNKISRIKVDRIDDICRK